METIKYNNKDSYIIKTTGEVIVTHPKNGEAYTLEELQQAVGGYIEAVRIPNPDYVMVANEEGVLHNLPYNHKGSTVAQRNILGDVIIMPESMLK